MSFKLANGNIPISLTSNFILPKDKRPHLSEVHSSNSIPIIDMKEDDESKLIQKISEACEYYGFFQIINHGVPDELCKSMLGAVMDFFNLPSEERAQFYTEDKSKPVRVSNYYLKVEGEEKVTMWGEAFTHPWNPVDNYSHLLPHNPPNYREVATKYAKEMGFLFTRLLNLISQGLGLDKDSLKEKIGENPELNSQANYYPPCPDPELTLGLGTHTDLGSLTILLQCEEVSGLQVIKDDKWITVEPVPNAFVVNLADQIQVLSNGKYKSVHHRAVTNKELHRVSLATFYKPDKGTIIGPMKDLISEKCPSLYRDYRYGEFIEEFHKQEGKRRRVKEAFELNP